MKTSPLGRLCVIVPGFGQPHLNVKLDIFHKNVRKIRSYPWSKLLFKVFCYDQSVDCLDASNATIQLEQQKGAVGDFLVNLDVDAFDYVMVLLDDVELQDPVDFETLCRYQSSFGFDILSPVLTRDSLSPYVYMYQDADAAAWGKLHLLPLPRIRMVSVCELFCYFMSLDGFRNWRAHLDPSNPYCWGMDLLLHKKMNLKVGLVNDMTMKHYFRNASPNTEIFEAFHRYLEKYGETQETLATQRTDLYCVFDYGSEKGT